MTTILPSPHYIVDDYGYKHDLLIGCGLAVAGNLLISISLNLQKYTHMQNEKRGDEKHYTRSAIWWLGLTLMILGELGNFSAYGFAPASLVAPLGTTTVVANMFIAVIFLKEKLRIEDIFGCTFAMVGAFLLVSFSQKDEKILTASEIITLLLRASFIVYCIIEILAIVILFVLYYKYKSENVLVLLLITSLLASFTVLSAKGVSSMLNITLGGNMQIQHPLFWIMLVIMLLTAVAQVKYLNVAMKSFNATIVVPTNFVFFTISAIVAGIVMYMEFWGMSALEVFMFLFGCSLCFIGVYFITVGRADVASDGDAEEEDSASQGLPAASSFPASLRKVLPEWMFMKLSSEPEKKADEEAIVEQDFAAMQQEESSNDSLPMSTKSETSPVSKKNSNDYGTVQ